MTIEMPISFDNENKKTLDLMAFVEHIGSTPNSGHYVAYVKEDGKWYYHSDEEVREVPEGQISNKAKKMYIAIYHVRE